MEQSSSYYEQTIRHQFDRICKLALKGEKIDYLRHIDYRRKHEVMLSELSEKEMNKLFVMDEYNLENPDDEVFGQINAVESKVCEPLNGMVRKEYDNLAPFKRLK